MRYLDTGSRDPDHALGTWLRQVLEGPVPVVAARVQTAYFGSQAMGYLERPLQVLSRSDGPTYFLVGSNEGQTSRAAVADLLRLAGPPRPGLRVGIVSFTSGLFHPKVFHFQRADGSATAYVGSANLTFSGATSLNVEAAMIVDTLQGDPQHVLSDIAGAIDAWFVEQRPGLYLIGVDADLEPLVAAGVLDVPAPVRGPRNVRPVRQSGAQEQPGHGLHALVPVPPIATPLAQTTVTGVQPDRTSPGQAATPAGAVAAPLTVVRRWYKELDQSNAQRLGGNSNPSGHLTLTRGPAIPGQKRHPINHRSYFREQFFGRETWEQSSAEGRENAHVAVHVVVYGQSLGTYDLAVDHNPSFESGEGNRLTTLRWGPLSDYLGNQRDHTGDVVTIEQLSDGTYRLTLGPAETGPFIA